MTSGIDLDLLPHGEEEEEQGSQYLTFVLAGEDYGVSILQVQEIRGWEKATRVPNAPNYVCGVINLRGTIVPVFDMRLRFNLEPTDYTPETVVIVVRTGDGGSARSMGLVVDAVSDVLNVQDDQISTTPEFGASVPTENITGLVTDGEKMVMLLDLESLRERDGDADETAAA